MSSEVERCFLVDPRLWEPLRAGVDMRQGYLSSAQERVVRVRIAGEAASIAVKVRPCSFARSEFECPVALEDGKRLLALCDRPYVEKTRHAERHGDHDWTIDVFHGENQGLTLAVIELATERERFFQPAWLGAEVSDDARYLGVNLARTPYRAWA